ncbi:MAG: ABC transporter permease [Bacteroidota bacterium]
MYAVKAWRDGSLGDAVFSSAARMSLGFLLGSTIGVALAVVVGSSRLAAGLLEPLAKFFQAVAGPTWIPLAVLWFGMGWVSVSFIIFNTVFFLVFYNTLMGIRTVNQTLVNAVLTLGGRRWDVLREVLIPGSVQGMMVGLRIGIGYGWRALIAAEMIASGRGLGVLIWEGGRYFAISRIFVGLLLIGLISFVLDKAMAQLEEHTLGRWGMLNRV